MSNKAPTSLCDLPTEIQHLIVLNLHPSAAIALKQTNRWFHTHISLHRLDQREVFQFLSAHETLPKFSKNSQQGKRTSYVGYACFKCLSIRPAIKFTEFQVTGRYAKRPNSLHPSYVEPRACIDCSLKRLTNHAGQALKMADGKTLNVFCPACKSMQAYFCHDCWFCRACIAKSKWWAGKTRRYGDHERYLGTLRPCENHHWCTGEHLALSDLINFLDISMTYVLSHTLDQGWLIGTLPLTAMYKTIWFSECTIITIWIPFSVSIINELLDRLVFHCGNPLLSGMSSGWTQSPRPNSNSNWLCTSMHPTPQENRN